MQEDKRARLRQWLASGEARLQPLSLPQRELWEATPVAVSDPANHICCLINVEGRITGQECEAALQRVIERQEVLRLCFLPGKDGPLQMIRRTGGACLKWQGEETPDIPADAVEEEAQRIFRQPFDLVQSPLYRVEVLRPARDKHVLVFAIHHALADGWSLGVFVQDLVGAFLQGRRGRHEPLPAVPLSYTAWAAAEKAAWTPAEIERRAAYWRSILDGRQRLWPAADATPGPLQRWVTKVPAEHVPAIRELARRSNTTLFSTLLATFQLALCRWTGVADIVVGTPVANRNKPAARETMGYFSGVVPLRRRINPDLTMDATLRAVHESAMDGFASAMPFAELVRALGEVPAAGRHPIFEVRFALQNHPVPDVSLPALSTQLLMRSTGTARFSLGCEITEVGPALEVVWLFQTGLFTEAGVQELDRLFQGVLRSACDSPEASVATLIA